MRLTIAGEELEARADATLWWPRASTLLAADLHLGKDAVFRAAGQAVPEGSSPGTLARLAGAVEHTRARRLVLLGDVVHGRASLNDGLRAEVESWRARLAELEVLVVLGNHDRAAGSVPAELGATVSDEHVAPPFLFRHEPCARDGAVVIAGHVHPGVVLRDSVGKLRLRCFHLSEAAIVLPAFGDFTGMQEVEPAPADRVLAIAGEKVVEVPRAALPRGRAVRRGDQ